MRIIFTSIFILFFLSACEKSKNSSDPAILPDAVLKTEVLTQSLKFPWEIIYGPDNFIWFTERAGKISRLNPSTGVITLVRNITEVNSIGEGGLLGMVLHPQFNANPFVYVIYDYGTQDNYKGKVVRFTFNNGVLSAPLVLLDQIPASANHNGSRLLITPDLKLLITTGDANAPAQAQNTKSLSGKILRLNLDGTIPDDNPLPGNPLWSYGHRNPQGLVIANNALYSSEHGPDTTDKINLIQKGHNYGWPNVAGKTGPIFAWTPTIAPSGLTYYNSDYIPQWRNSLLVVALKGAMLTQLQLDADEIKIKQTKNYFENQFGRLRAICQSPDGKVYIATSNGTNDQIIEISAH